MMNDVEYWPEVRLLPIEGSTRSPLRRTLARTAWQRSPLASISYDPDETSYSSSWSMRRPSRRGSLAIQTIRSGLPSRGTKWLTGRREVNSPVSTVPNPTHGQLRSQCLASADAGTATAHAYGS